MRNLEVIENDLAAARETLSQVEGTPAEVYSRIVGYYRSVRNWNRGKREEYGERRLYNINEQHAAASSPPCPPEKNFTEAEDFSDGEDFSAEEMQLLLFVRSSCPNCPPAKAATENLGIPVELVNADTTEGMAEAVRRNVMSTPTAILLSPEGRELGRAGTLETISRLLEKIPIAELIEV